MTLKEYLKEVNKDRCPEECEFKSKKEIEIAKIPPPKETLGIIISRDPTTDWLDTAYEKAEEQPDNMRRKTLFDTAIPLQLIKRIKNFMSRKPAEEDIKHLFEMIYENVYWTHLHKCFTDKSGESSIKFKNKNANKCADRWLAEELNIAINDKTKFIIVLGNDVQEWICEWREDYCKNKNMKIIYLPHPSPANVGRSSSWHPETKNRERIEKRINSLLKLCKTIA